MHTFKLGKKLFLFLVWSKRLGKLGVAGFHFLTNMSGGANLPDEGCHFCQWQRAQHKPRAAAPRRMFYGGRAIVLGQCEREVLDRTPREQVIWERRKQQRLVFVLIEENWFALRCEQTPTDERLFLKVLF